MDGEGSDRRILILETETCVICVSLALYICFLRFREKMHLWCRIFDFNHLSSESTENRARSDPFAKTGTENYFVEVKPHFIIKRNQDSMFDVSKMRAHFFPPSLVVTRNVNNSKDICEHNAYFTHFCTHSFLIQTTKQNFIIKRSLPMQSKTTIFCN